MKKFNLKNTGNYNYYNANILDIWYQDNKIVAYVEGTYIYRTEMIIKNDEIYNYYCNCPSSEGGMSFCKHLSGVAKYLKDNEILKMESEPIEEEQLDLSLTSEEIIKKFRNTIYNLIDSYYGRINCYNSSKYLETIVKNTKYIDNLLEKEKTNEAFLLTIQFIDIATDVSVDSEDDYNEGINEITNYIDELINNYNYKEDIINYINENYKEKEISSVGINLIYVLVNNIETESDAKNIINIIKNIKIDDYDRYDLIDIMLNISHDYIGLDETIKLANKYRDIYSVKRKIIEYIEETNDEEKLIKELKRQIKDNESINLYEKLLNIYLKNNTEEAQKLLLIMINEYGRIDHYKKLKTICNKTKMNSYKKEILNNINKNSYRNRFLLEIYEEDNMVEKLFKEIKKYNELSILSKYKEKINTEYHNELLDSYKKLIINKASKCYGRNEYYNLCTYIRDLYLLKCPSNFIIEMLKEMYPSYKTKKAFKEEIINVLKENDKKNFQSMVQELDKIKK